LETNVHGFLGLRGAEQDGLVVRLGAVESGAGAETQIVLDHRRAAEKFSGESAARPSRNGIDGTRESAAKHFFEQAELAVDFGGAAGDTHGFRVARNAGVFFDENRGDAEFPEQNGRHQTAWTAANDDNLWVFLFHNLFLFNKMPGFRKNLQKFCKKLLRVGGEIVF
jgi:hypothetical protein